VTWRLQIRHSTGYRYAGSVSSSYNEARVTPLTTDRQTALETSVTVEPPTTPFRYWDYWGTLVDAFDVHQPHTELSVIGTSVVETFPPPDDLSFLDWPQVRRPEIEDRYAELLAPTTYVPEMAEAEEAVEAAGAASSPAEAVRVAADWVRDHLRYVKGATHVRTTAADALRGGAGVCQDFAHLTLSVLRCLGIPARYVSGYLYPDKEAEVGAEASGESHAWVEAWTGDWWAVDPTHGVAVGERHVVVGRGRDYSDVTPLKGIYHGAPATGLAVRVELTRLA
jgi:transglutaminase-like putative cysteine protease